MGIAASTLSQHFALLNLIGLVTQERQSTTLLRRADDPAMDALLGFLADECCPDACAPENAARRPFGLSNTTQSFTGLAGIGYRTLPEIDDAARLFAASELTQCMDRLLIASELVRGLRKSLICIRPV